MTKLGIFDPYLDTIGGGERYCLSLAEAALGQGWRVDIFWKDSEIKSQLVKKLGLNLDGLNFIDYSPTKSSLFQRRRFEKDYDAIFWVSDGSLPLMFAKKNLLHFQVPFKSALSSSIVNRIKLRTINQLVCNSRFTSAVIGERLQVKPVVVYPPVDIEPIEPGKKQNLILAVGRFSQLLQGKRQDILVEVFREMIDSGQLKRWRLVLVGGSEVGGRKFIGKLRRLAQGYPVKILENPPFEELVKLYSKAKVFWNASGFGIDEEVAPEKVEHFGITTVEAMAAGCVPVVVGKGGQKEIVDRNQNGLWWQTKEELARLTLELVASREVMNKLSRNAILRSKAFSKQKFAQQILNLISS